MTLCCSSLGKAGCHLRISFKRQVLIIRLVWHDISSTLLETKETSLNMCIDVYSTAAVRYVLLAFLWNYTDQDHSGHALMHQRNRWIQSGWGFIDWPWSVSPPSDAPLVETIVEWLAPQMKITLSDIVDASVYWFFSSKSVKSLSSAPTNIFHTSGTTGNAKMMEHSQASTGLGTSGMRK